jgi:hypothetical protein
MATKRECGRNRGGANQAGCGANIVARVLTVNFIVTLGRW